MPSNSGYYLMWLITNIHPAKLAKSVELWVSCTKAAVDEADRMTPTSRHLRRRVTFGMRAVCLVLHRLNNSRRNRGMTRGTPEINSDGPFSTREEDAARTACALLLTLALSLLRQLCGAEDWAAATRHLRSLQAFTWPVNK